MIDMTRFALGLVLSTALVTSQTFAEDQPADLIAVPEPPPIPSRVESGEVMEPDITITQRTDEILVEYRYAGRLVAIKVIPRNRDFPPYYLVDADGDGNFEARRNELGPDVLVNSWVLFSWD